jgi:hypothetical protein
MIHIKTPQDIEEYKAQFVAKNKLAIATEESEEEPVPGFTD